MPPRFSSRTQEGLFQKLLGELKRLGYEDELVKKYYKIPFYFTRGAPRQTVPTATLGQPTPSYESACFAVLLSNGKAGEDLVQDYRALGAPLAFEIGQEKAALWIVGLDSSRTSGKLQFDSDSVARIFSDHAPQWKPQS